MPQLDSLRFFAVLLVMGEHWIPDEYLNGGEYFLGYTGVTFFFVLSGYLITGILLQNKKEAEKKEIKKTSLIKSFFIRRSLRIFPIYYAVILFFLIIPFPMGDEIKQNAGYYLLYLNNFLMYFEQDWPLLGHTWTLAVEEQFYLIWPWVILFTQYKYLWKVFIVFVVIGFFSHFLFYYLSWSQGGANLHQGFYTILTPARFDAFALGALGAWAHYFLNFSKGKLYSVTKNIFYPLLSIWILLLYFQKPDIFFYTMKFFVVMLSLGLVIMASRGIGGLGKVILENPLIIYLGKISYGLYLFHHLVAYFYMKISGSFVPEISNDGLKFLVFFILTVAVSMLSWHLFEKPINNLKKHISYSPSIEVSRVQK